MQDIHNVNYYHCYTLSVIKSKQFLFLYDYMFVMISKWKLQKQKTNKLRGP
jgi:hypothetical protein